MNEDERIPVLEVKMEDADRRISNLEKMMNEVTSLTRTVERLAIMIENLVKEQTEFSGKVNSLTDRMVEMEKEPYKTKANSYDIIWKEVVVLLIGGVSGYLARTLLGM